MFANPKALVVVSKALYLDMLRAKTLIEQYMADIPPQEVNVQHPNPPSIPSSSASLANALEELRKGAELRDAGIITDEEFEKLKRKLMNA
ncbi:SHOCT domain-containing protein [Cohnella terricola]|uniref:SHOCT domain-containing protein n=1 Tax=Cohnella terricola TaxID=1289167 RepID=UPI0016453664|nr:SHOCT domain-containing protein [Cohnella terricola]